MTARAAPTLPPASKAVHRRGPIYVSWDDPYLEQASMHSHRLAAEDSGHSGRGVPLSEEWYMAGGEEHLARMMRARRVGHVSQRERINVNCWNYSVHHCHTARIPGRKVEGEVRRQRVKGAAGYEPTTWCRESQEAHAIMAQLCDLEEACWKNPPGYLHKPRTPREDVAPHQPPRPPKAKAKAKGLSPKSHKLKLGSQHPKRGWTPHPSTPHKHRTPPFAASEPVKGVWDFSFPVAT